MKSVLRKYPLSIVILLVICYLSFFKPPKSDLDEIQYIDKVAHICMYGGLGLIIWLEYLRSHISINKERLFTGAILLPILFSGGIELIQEYGTTHRGGDWSDLMANSIGILLAAAFGNYILRPYLEKHPQYKKKSE